MTPEEIAKRIDEWWFGHDDPKFPVEGDVPGETLRETITLALHAYRAQVIEEAAAIADQFKCGGCGMDGKSAEAIRALANP